MTNSKTLKIRIPKGCFRGGDCCADCIYLDLNRKESYGDKCFCVKKRDYYSPTDTIARYCSDYRSR